MKLLMLFISTFFAPYFALATSSHYEDITYAELKAAIASGHIALLDANGGDSYRQAHIPGAIDFETHESKIATILPKDKTTLIVAYCGGPTCTAYRDAYDAAITLGYTNVKHYAEGISGWLGRHEKVDKN
jgi:rhodanese-related sulfurtransferase